MEGLVLEVEDGDKRPASRARSPSPPGQHAIRATAGGLHSVWRPARPRSPMAMPNLAPVSGPKDLPPHRA